MLRWFPVSGIHMLKRIGHNLAIFTAVAAIAAAHAPDARAQAPASPPAAPLPKIKVAIGAAGLYFIVHFVAEGALIANNQCGFAGEPVGIRHDKGRIAAQDIRVKIPFTLIYGMPLVCLGCDDQFDAPA